MKAWGWLAVALLPSCVLVSPLDDAKPEGAGGSAQAAGAGATPSRAGSGNSANGGSGNAANGGDDDTGGTGNTGGTDVVDFSLFTGTWNIDSGETKTTCAGQEMTEQVTSGTTSIGLGTTSDLILDPTTECPILLDVVDRTATAQPDQTCQTVSGTLNLTAYIDYFDFIITDADTSATTTFYSTVVSDTGVTCKVEQTLYYVR